MIQDNLGGNVIELFPKRGAPLYQQSRAEFRRTFLLINALMRSARRRLDADYVILTFEAPSRENLVILPISRRDRIGCLTPVPKSGIYWEQVIGRRQEAIARNNRDGECSFMKAEAQSAYLGVPVLLDAGRQVAALSATCGAACEWSANDSSYLRATARKLEDLNFDVTCLWTGAY